MTDHASLKRQRLCRAVTITDHLLPAKATDPTVSDSPQPGFTCADIPTWSNWLAFARTHTWPCPEELPPTNPLDRRPVLALPPPSDRSADDSSFAPEKDAPLPARRSFAGEDEPTRAFPPPEDDDGEDEPTRAFPPLEDKRHQIHEQPTRILADSDSPGSGSPPTISTGFFSQQAETVIGAAQRVRRRWRLLRVCTRAGVCALVLASVTVVVVLVSMDPEIEAPTVAPEQNAVSASTFISIHSQPEGAEILLCGEPTGLVAPAEVSTTPSKRCKLELRLEGYDSYSMWIPRTRRPTNIVATLRRKTGRLSRSP
jgi:hypothetical protein